jgi:hypothetical protein
MIKKQNASVFSSLSEGPRLRDAGLATLIDIVSQVTLLPDAQQKMEA